MAEFSLSTHAYIHSGPSLYPFRSRAVRTTDLPSLWRNVVADHATASTASEENDCHNQLPTWLKEGEQKHTLLVGTIAINETPKFSQHAAQKGQDSSASHSMPM